MSEQNVDSLIKLIDDAILNFNSSIPEVQRQISDELQVFFKDLELDGKRLANTDKNMRLLGKLKNKIDEIVLSDEYKQKVAAFVKSFDDVYKWHATYFNALVKKFSPPKVLEAIRQDAITSTVELLTESGITADVSNALTDIVRININGGGQYSDLLKQMQTFIMGDGKQLGALQQYAGTYTTDAINTFSANVNQTIGQDLGMEWFRITGSLLETSRPMCVEMSKDQFFHISQIPELLKGIVNGRQTPINKRNGLPLGFKDNTTVANYLLLRNGWRCGHQMLMTLTMLVPEVIRRNFPSRKNPPKKEENPVPVPVPSPATINTLKGIEDSIRINHNVPAVSLRGMPLATAKRTMQQLSDLLNSYAVRNLRKIATYTKSKDHATAYTATAVNDSYREIYFNLKTFKEDTRPPERDFQTKFAAHVDDDNKDIYIITHEFMHAIVDMQAAVSSGIYPAFVKGVMQVRSEYLAIGAEMQLKHIAGKITDAEFTKFVDETYISRYANTSPDEFLAEAFTNATLSSHPSPYAVRVKELVDKYFKKK